MLNNSIIAIIDNLILFITIMILKVILLLPL